MRCPFCDSKNIKVLETRELRDNTTRRRKICLDCGKRFTTYETIEFGNLIVIKKDGRKERFDKEKIYRGIKIAFEKRNVSEEKLREITNDVVQKIYSLGLREIKSTRIGMYVLNRIKKVDKIAYIRFASVYRDFETLERLEQELNKLLK